MYVEIDEIKKNVAANTKSMTEYVASLREDEPTVVLRNYNEPKEPPCFEKNVEQYDFTKAIALPYGTKRNIPGINVINAIKSALGSGGYALHISDGSYTEYTIHELKEFMDKFDSTHLKVWIAEVFDCDDFSQALQGNVNNFFPGIAFGTIWYGPNKPNPDWGHSVNLFYNNQDNQVYLVEPQNNTFYKFNRETWKAWMVIM